jgi:hypothetical protein
MSTNFFQVEVLLIVLKIGHFTLDNASNNETMLEELERLLHDRDFEFDAVDRRIRCFAHIVDLCSGRVIKAISEDDESTGNPIGLARGAVRSIRGSGLRRDAFDETVKNGNDKGWFKTGDPPKTVQLKPLQLLRDMSVRWDSVYFMVNRLGVMRPV